MYYLENLPWHFGSLVIVLFAISLAVLGFLFIQKLFKNRNVRYENDVVGNILGVIGVFYAVLMGFLIIEVEQRFRDAHNAVELEADYLTDLFRDAQVFPEDMRKSLRQKIKTYVKEIMVQEWGKNNGRPNEKGMHLMHDIWQTYYDFNPTTEKEIVWYTQSISKLNDLSNARLQRLYNSYESLENLMWLLLAGGAIFVTLLLYLFKVENSTFSLAMIAMLVGFIAFMLYLIYALDTVFTGELRVRPDALEKVVHLFEVWEI